MTPRVIAVTGTMVIALSNTQAVAADCGERLEQVREKQAKTAYLDPQRRDLAQLRRVARSMADKGRERLCLELVDELDALVKDHREHAAKVDQLANYANAVPLSEAQGQLTSERLIDLVVRNRTGKELGEVQGLVISPDTGRVQAIKFIHGGFLGIGEQTVEIPWEQVRLSVDGAALVVDMTEHDIEQLSQKRNT